jgi:dipeptidyl-peptidase 4
LNYNHYTMRASLLFLLISATAFGQKKAITLDALEEIGRLPSAGLRGNPLAWSPDGTHFVYRQGERLMIFDAATQVPMELFDLSKLPVRKPTPAVVPQPFEWQNRRVSESPVQWSSDGSKILYATGGELFLIDVDGGAAKSLQVSAARDPKLSPDGRKVAFIHDWDLYALDLSSNKQQRLTSNGSYTLRNGAPDWVYPEELDLGTGYWWAPDSKSIAYLRFDTSGEALYPHADLRGESALAEPQRYPQAGERNPDVRLGVVSAKGGATKWFDTGNTVWDYLLARVTWTPDSKKLFVTRSNRVQSRVELLAYQVESRKATKVLEESDLYWVNILDEPSFLKGGMEFLWQSERDGYAHIYLYSADGRLVRRLTEGAWAVTSIDSVDESAGVVYYTSTEASPLERHTYVVGLNGQGKRDLSAGAGTNGMIMGPNAKYFLRTYSSLTSPPRMTLHSGDGREMAVYRESDKRVQDQYAILPTELSSFRGPDGSQLYTRLIRPANFDPAKKYPAVIQVYGGPGAQGPRNAWYGADFDQALANAGFVVWQVDNRGSAGRGHAFEIPLFRSMGPVELSDQVAGVKQLVSMGFVDPAKVGIRGWSYGGFMTLNAMLNASDTFRAGAAGAPVTDWRNYDTIYTERYMGLPEANAEGYKNTVLPQRAANLKGKLMILHNYEDDNVLFQNSLQMIDALERAGKQFELVLYTQKTHGVSGPEARHVDAAMLGFFERALK